MAREKRTKDLRYWVEVFNRAHGYGGVFGYRDAQDKTIMELATAEEWQEAMRQQFGIELGDPVLNASDPPDCFVEFKGRVVSVELTQLISAEHRRRAAKGESQFAGQLFKDTRWSQERFATELEEAIHRKGNKYLQNGIFVDVLVVDTAEPWLFSWQVSEWLRQIDIPRHTNVMSVFLLMDYEPGNDSGSWPLFRIYGGFGED